MDKKIIEKIQTAMELDEKKQDDFAAYDDMDEVKYDFGDMLEPWMIPSIATEPTIALKTLANTFDTHNPKVRVTPFGEADKERAELLERWVEFHFAKINQRAGHSPIRKIPHQIGKYGRVALQVDYLPYWLPKNKEDWSKEQKQQIRAGNFCIDIHNPRNIYFEMGKYGLRWVAAVTNLSATEIREHWAVYDDGKKEGKQIQAALEKIQKEYDEDEEVRFIHVDFTSYDVRQVSVFKTSKKDIEDFEDFDEKTESIEILNTENKLGFLNWVVVECDSSPLLEPVHKGNLYAYQTVFDTAKKSSIMRRAFPPVIVSKTLNRKGVDVDYTGAEAEIKLDQNESVEPMVMPPIDQGVFTLASEEANRMSNALGVSKLAGMEASNVQYSTVNALIDLNMANLEPYKRGAEKALEQVAYIMFKWVEFTKDTVEAIRTKKSNPDQVVGEQILISETEIGSADDLLITIDLTSKTDKVQAANKISMIKQNGFRVPDAELLEEIGYDNPETLASMYEDEQLKNLALQLLIKELTAKKDLEIQAQQMQMQNDMQMQQQAQMQQMQQPPQDPNAQGPMGQLANPDQSMPSAPQGQGFDAAMGGQSPMMAQPGMTASQVPGQRAQ